ncbi:AbrB/MazE/SpoVT family DNA-binding domain-containing protein [Candidatus Woesearchaeota archaeon]|nr:AbrB/MazE/SpoVT family DNA-binding domain-containing protein [Candidatus Woesearchaeota archaeon]
MGIAKVTRNYQVTIPRDIRKVQGIEIGDTVLFAIEGNRVDFFKTSRDQILADAAGAWKGKVESGTKYVRDIRKGWITRRKRLGL